MCFHPSWRAARRAVTGPGAAAALAALVFGQIVGGASSVSAQPAKPSETRPYDATSNTAMSITGSLRLSPTQLVFSHDQSYRTEAAGTVVAADEYAKGAGGWSALLNVPADARIELRRVVDQRVGAKAPNGGLCGPEKTTFIALILRDDPYGGASLKMASFKGAVKPGPAAAATALCGTFLYSPAAVKMRAPRK